MPDTLTREQLHRFAELAETVVEMEVPFLQWTEEYFSIRGLDGALADDELTPGKLNEQLVALIGEHYEHLMDTYGESSDTLHADNTMSVLAAVFGALCDDPSLEEPVRAGDPATLVDVMAGNWSPVAGCEGQPWVADSFAPAYQKAAELWRAHHDEQGRWLDTPRAEPETSR